MKDEELFQTEDAYNDAERALEKKVLALIEKQARLLLHRYSYLNEFVMAMGTFFFTTQHGMVWHGEYDPNNPDSEELTFEEKGYQILDEFILEYDSKMNIMGTSMRFSKDSPIKTDW